MSVATQIRKALDRIARGRQVSQSVWSSGDDFWTLADDAQNEAYENTIKGSELTQMDSALSLGAYWNSPGLAKWFDLHNQYFRKELGLANPLLANYLKSVGWRAPYEAAQSYMDATGVRLSPQLVFAKGTTPSPGEDPSDSGMHQFGSFTATGDWTLADGALSTDEIAFAPIVAINTGAGQTAGGTFRCIMQDATSYKDIALSLSGVAQYSQTILGSEDLTSSAASGTDAVSVSTTGQFDEGEYVLVYESDSLQELAQVESISTDSSITFTDNLVNSYTTSASVVPLFTAVEYESGGSGSGTIDFYAMPDRQIAL